MFFLTGTAKESPVAKPTGSKSKVNNQNNRGETSLHLAAIKGDIQVAESLISQGADVNAQDYAGKFRCSETTQPLPHREKMSYDLRFLSFLKY